MTPLDKRGLLYLDSGEEGFLHLYWKDRKTNAVEEDLIIFPEEALFKKLAHESASAYVLLFKSSSQKLIFWIQEKNPYSNQSIMGKFNELMNPNPNSSEMSS